MAVPTAWGDTMLRAILVVTACLISSAAFACNPVEAQVGIQWCKEQCDVTHSNAQCNGSGHIGQGARDNDANAIRDGFAWCHYVNDDREMKQKANVEACFLNARPSLIAVACNVYGCPKPPPPKPAVTAIEFNRPMFTASDDKTALIADFVVSGKGEFQQITLDYRRDEVRHFDFSTYAVGFEQLPDGKLHVKITMYDRTVKNTSRYRYTVAGTLYVLAP